MRAALLWSVVVGAALMVPLGAAGADGCNEMGSIGPRLIYALDGNDTALGANSTSLYVAGNLRPAGVCLVPTTQPWDPLHSAARMPLPEPAWPAFNSTEIRILGSKEVKIQWTTNTPTVARVAWGPTGDAPTGAASFDEFSPEHGLWIRGLEPGRTYALHITIFDASAHAEVSEEITFMTPLPPRDTGADSLLIGLSMGATLGICELLRRKSA